MAEPAGFEEVKKMILETCAGSPEGISNTVLNANMSTIDPKLRMQVINKLLAAGQIEYIKKGGEHFIRRKAALSAKEAGAFKTMNDPEERVLYKLITAAGNKGVWLRDLRVASNLPQTQVTKLLKIMEQKKLIKSIKSVSAAKRKVYMLFDLEPDKSLTGGAWFSDQDFESEFVDVLTDQVAKFLSRKAQSSKERYTVNGPLAVANASFVTVQQVHHYIDELKISKVSLTLKEVASILDALVLDGLAERDVSVRQAEIDGEEDADDDGDEAEVSQLRYRAGIDPMDAPGWLRTPCGVCPVIDKCSFLGSVTPLKCEYYADWLNE